MWIIVIAKNTYCRNHLLQISPPADITYCRNHPLQKSPIAENHLRFQAYIPVSSVAVDITMDKFISSMVV
jgi:hypothetical protein